MIFTDSQFLETFHLGVKNLSVHKLRSALTALGVIFGVGAVISMLAIGEGASSQVLAQINALGAQNVILRSVEPGRSAQESGRGSLVRRYGLTRKDLQRARNIVPNTRRVVAIREVGSDIYAGAEHAAARAFGAPPEYLQVVNLHLVRGRFVSPVDMQYRAKVCVLGADIAAELFSFRDPIGKSVHFGNNLFSVVGVMAPIGIAGETGTSLTARNLNRDVYVPLTTSEALFGDLRVTRRRGQWEAKEVQLHEIYVQADSVDVVEEMSRILEFTISKFHDDRAVDYEVIVPLELLRQAERTKHIFQGVLFGIAFISLLVGGIGIMNIMLATVTERTREIGIRRALGAKRRDIVVQFLTETILLTTIGGLAGVLLGVALAKLATYMLEYPTDVTPWSVLLSFTVSALVGVGFGMYPAVVAARMDPIEALRHE